MQRLVRGHDVQSMSTRMSYFFIYALLFSFWLSFFACFSSDCFSSVILVGVAERGDDTRVSEQWYTLDFPFPFFPSFFVICKKIKSCYWNYVVFQSCRVLIHVRHRSSVFHFWGLIWTRTTHTKLKDTPSHLYCVLDVYIYFVFSFSCFFAPSILYLAHCFMSKLDQFPYTWLTTQLNWNCLFRTDRVSCLFVCVCVYVETGYELWGVFSIPLLSRDWSLIGII